jgi:hypothetical protein
MFEKMTLNEIHYNSATSTFLSVVGLALKKFSYASHALAYRINWEIHKQVKVVYLTILLHRKGNLTIHHVCQTFIQNQDIL